MRSFNRQEWAHEPMRASGMWARVGDQIVVAGPTVGESGRDGEIVGLHHPDGTPPYDVRWSDTGRVTVFFPGPDARIKHLTDHGHHTGRGTPRP